MLKALASGVVGALTLTAIHESARKALPHAPRMDVIGTRALSRPLRAAGRTPPHWNRLHRYALGGDVVSNSLFYSFVGYGPDRFAVHRGLVLGLAAGIGAVLLPPVFGLGRQPHRKSPLTELLTVAWYTLGGLAAGATMLLWTKPEEAKPDWL